MTPKQATNFMKALGQTPVSSNRSGWLVFHCPLAPWRHKSSSDKNPSFGVRIDGKREHLHCWSCHFSGDAEDMLMELCVHLRPKGVSFLNEHDYDYGYDTAAAYKIVAALDDEADAMIDGGDLDALLAEGPPELVEYPRHWIKSFGRLVDLGPKHPGVRYVVDRGMPEAVAAALDLRWDAYRRRVCFPVRDFDGALRGMHGRQIDGNSPPYLMYTYEQCSNPSVWLGESWVDLERPVLMAESVFDMARAVQVYRNTVTPLSSSINAHKLDRMAAAERVFTLFDADDAGEFARTRVSQYYEDSKVTHVMLGDGQDAGDLPPEELALVLLAHGLTPDRLVV